MWSRVEIYYSLPRISRGLWITIRHARWSNLGSTNSHENHKKLDLDFKGSLPNKNGNRYFLMVINKYSNLFSFFCSDVSFETLIQCICSLFSIFSVSVYIHNDWRTTFMSGQLKQFLIERYTAVSQTTLYNPQGNDIYESYNGVIWKTVWLATTSTLLHSGKSCHLKPCTLSKLCCLLYTSTKVTPHEIL